MQQHILKVSQIFFEKKIHLAKTLTHILNTTVATHHKLLSFYCQLVLPASKAITDQRSNIRKPSKQSNATYIQFGLDENKRK